MLGSHLDAMFFEELTEITGNELNDGLWSFLALQFKSRRARERALEAVERILSLYEEPILNSEKEIPSSAHYRTISELLQVSNHPRLVGFLTQSELLDLHPKWPYELRDHLQAPYRLIVERLAELRHSAAQEYSD